jgi:curli biogenesis system outer membrane secretion channel CsgG
MSGIQRYLYPILILALCASPPAFGQSASGEATATSSPVDALVLKRKIAVERFSNSTRYGRALLLPGELDPVEHQVTDILMARLIESNSFIIFEAPKSAKQGNAETSIQVKGTPFLDAVVVGSVTELGRRTEGKAGFLNSTVRQIATAKVDIRLVDARTGQAFFSTSGTGSAQLEAKEVAGFGSVASYDSSLIDRALSAAIADVASNVIQKLTAKRWETNVLDITGSKLFISGGPAQRLRIGQKLRLEEVGKTIVSNQTGTSITLPGRALGVIEIQSFFGDTPETEGAQAIVVEGAVGNVPISSLVVREIER